MSFGSQIVHNIYRPLDDLDEYIEKYRKNQDELFSASEKQRLKQINQSKQTADWKYKSFKMQSNVYVVMDWVSKIRFSGLGISQKMDLKGQLKKGFI